MDTRARIFVLFFPLLIAGQAAAMDFSSMGNGMATAITHQSQTLTVASSDGAAAEAHVKNLGDQAINTIQTSSDDAARKQTFRRLLTQNFDMARIGRFAMGKFWRVATPAQQAEYQTLFEKMVIDVYTARFSKYSGETFSVTGNRVDEASGDIVVTSKVTGSGSPVTVDWRVRPNAGSYRVIDVMVEGVSMAVTQRNDFAGIIQQGGGTVDALLDYLRKGGTSDVKK